MLLLFSPFPLRTGHHSGLYRGEQVCAAQLDRRSSRRTGMEYLLQRHRDAFMHVLCLHQLDRCPSHKSIIANVNSHLLAHSHT
jgi:hypothetical protein